MFVWHLVCTYSPDIEADTHKDQGSISFDSLRIFANALNFLTKLHILAYFIFKKKSGGGGGRKNKSNAVNVAVDKLTVYTFDGWLEILREAIRRSRNTGFFLA